MICFRACFSALAKHALKSLKNVMEVISLASLSDWSNHQK